MQTSYLCLAIFLTIVSSISAAPLPPQSRPHILFIVADDLGWNDVGFHNPDMITPNIDELANSGIIFNQAYVQPVCSPSRASFMTGMFPFKIGLQHWVIGPQQATCVPFNYTFLPQELKSLGYATHAVGKWHLGFCKWECTPTYRGFDTFFGFYNADEHYYTHIFRQYLDYRDNELPARNYSGEYSAYTFAKRAQDIIRAHNETKPLFMYLPFQNVHAPLEVPKKYENMYSNVVNKQRRIHSGMVSILDEAVGNITNTLKEQGLFNNTLILFTTDNGGALPSAGNNYPLRGGKFTLWEGGTRGVAFMSGHGLIKTGITYDGMLHAVDWKPTLVSAAGGTPSNDTDGADHWDEIRNARPSTRTEFVYNLDDYIPSKEGHAAIRVGDYKLIEGYPGEYDGWYKPFNKTRKPPIYTLVFHPGDKPVLLYNIRNDPTEKNDLSKTMPQVVTKLQARMQEYRKQMVPPNFPRPDPAADPTKFGNAWTPGWC